MRSSLLPILFVAACGDHTTAVTTDGGTSTTVDRGPRDLVVDGDPNGLWWDATANTLYIADNQNDRILQWTDAKGFSLAAALPAAPSDGPDLGQVVRLADGTLVTTQFGFGTAGAVVYAKPDGTNGSVPNLDPTRRRIGLTIASDGSLYDSYFTKLNGNQVGAIAKLSIDGPEEEIITGLQKPVGVLAIGTNLYVSDQDQSEIFVAPIASPSTYTAFVPFIDSPDLLSAGPNGSMYTGATDGAVNQIASDGTVSSVASGYKATRGTAYDAVNKRLFVADHDSSTTNPVQLLHIVPID